MKENTVFSLAAAAALTAVAAPVSVEEAQIAAENWIETDAPADVALSPVSVSAETFITEDCANEVHVVSLAGGGYVVTSADDELEPILAFSASGEFSAEPGSPLAALLAADLRARQAAAAPAPAATHGKQLLGAMAAAPASSGASSESKSKWDRLLARDSGAARGGRLLSASSGISSISSIYVKPLVQSTWGQSTVSGKNCYNYYTPKNYVCGCVATAMAQLMRYHRFPSGPVLPKTVTCKVDEASTALPMIGGTYDWANMPTKPSNPSDAQCKAIGKLTYDCGVSVGMSYKETGSSAQTAKVKTALTSTFGYASAEYKSFPESSEFHSLVQRDLEQSRPVLLAITGDGGHAIVADGYGYDGSTPYYHLNMGWRGNSDLWYNLPNVEAGGYSFNTIQEIVYNIQPPSSTPSTQPTLNDAVDCTALTFTTGGDADWEYQTSITYDGVDAARSGKIGDSKNTWMRATTSGRGEITFYWKCDTGNSLWGSDDVTFSIDGVCKNTINGDTGWSKKSYTVAESGLHTFEWKYKKDNYGAIISRRDCAWVDQVTWTPKIQVTLMSPNPHIPTVFEAVGKPFLVDSHQMFGYSDLLPTLVRDGWTFLGWYTAPTGGNKVTDVSVTASEDIVLYAQWRDDRPATLYFDANGGSVYPISKTYVSWTALGELPVPERAGYVFAGWYTNPVGGARVYESDVYSSPVDRTLYAHWESAWTVTLDAKGGTLSSDKVTVARGAAVGPLETPVRPGYKFAGWYTRSSGGAKVADGTRVTANVTFYARWTVRKYTVAVTKVGKGSVSGTGSKDYRSQTTLKAAAASGYVFQGWYLDGTLKSRKTSYAVTVPLDGVTYTAVFVTKSADKAAIGLAVGDAAVGGGDVNGLAPAASLPPVSSVCGVVIAPLPVATAGLTPTSVAVSGLPAGLKYDAAKKAITGTPSTARTYTAKVTVKSRGASRAWSFKWTVTPLPAFARGTFDGWTYRTLDGAPDAEDPVRKVTVSVTKAGKITAKVGSLTLTRTGWTVREDGVYTAALRTVRTVGSGAKAKRYTDVLLLALDPEAAWTEDQLAGDFATFGGAVSLADARAGMDAAQNGDGAVSARRNAFGDNGAAKAVAAELAAYGAQTVIDETGTAWKVKVSAAGVATLSRTTGSGPAKKTVSATATVSVDPYCDGYLARARFAVSSRVIEVIW